jgi:3-hydroxyacyl-[acyl-carrier-protein] dehydratase
MNYIDALPHQPPMRLLDEVADVVPGSECRARRRTRPGDFFFDGHFPGTPVVPACILVEMIAQAGGIAAVEDTSAEPVQMRVAAFGPCRCPAAAGVDATLEISARVAGRMAGLYKLHGQVRAEGVLVADGEVTLARIRA